MANPENEPAPHESEALHHLRVVPEEAEQDRSEFDRLTEEHPEIMPQVEQLKEHFGHLAEAWRAWRAAEGMLGGPSLASRTEVLSWDKERVATLTEQIETSHYLIEGAYSAQQAAVNEFGRFRNLAGKFVRPGALAGERWRPGTAAKAAREPLQHGFELLSECYAILEELAQALPLPGESMFIVGTYPMTIDEVIAQRSNPPVSERRQRQIRNILQSENLYCNTPGASELLVCELPAEDDESEEAAQRRNLFAHWRTTATNPINAPSDDGEHRWKLLDHVAVSDRDAHPRDTVPPGLLVESVRLEACLTRLQALLDNLVYAQGAWALFQKQTGQLADLDFPAAYQALTD